ncbi:hypothetical protein ABT263_30960 [Kitasatospora sp. NPDC001603]|uniref:hypothetical protein n=1 Tax=Kitasatospora sp. NPDC001603 TaxID=3154388 RepID=UPI003328F90F
MRTQHRSLLALAATATLVSGTAVAAAPAALAAPSITRHTQGTLGAQAQNGPVSITLSGLPGTFTAGAAPVEFTATLKNSADHAVDATTGFTLADVNSGIKETQLKLEFQSPGGTQWKNALLSPGQTVGAVWELDTFATRISVPAGASVTYRLRLAVTAGAVGGTATAGFRAVVSDPTLPPEQRISTPASEFGRFTIAPVGGPSTPPVTAPGPAEPNVEGVPASFTTGGEAKAFKLVLANHSGKDIRVLPEVTLQAGSTLPADAVRFEFQTPEGEWLAARPLPEPATSRLILGLPSGSKDADLVKLHDGESRTINVRLAFAKDAPVGAASVLLTGHSMPEVSGLGVTTSSRAVPFGIAAPGGAGTPSATASATPSATATATGTASAPASPAPVPTAPSAAAVVVAQVTASAPNGPATTTAPVPVPVPVPDQAAGLASTGGGSSSAPMAITGGMAIAMGLGALVVLRRRQRTQRTQRPGR